MKTAVESAVESALVELLQLVEITAKTHDQSGKTEKWAGVSVSAKTSGIASVGAGNANRLDRITATVSVRSMIPALDPDAISFVWEAVSSAILSPQLPDGLTWPDACPSLAKFKHFSTGSEITSDRDDSDDRRKHTREFSILAAIS